MSDESQTVSLDQVIAAEVADIQKRRATMDLDPLAPGNGLVGVALSGGGLRASGFGLGVMQVFCKSGLWRFVDYLSTVSGGGYLGGLLATLVVNKRQNFGRDNCPLLPDKNGPQPAEVQRQIFGGNRLLKPWELLNRYLIGVVLLNATLFSGLISACALLAFLWRSFDYPAFRDRAGLVELNSDLYAPFIPAVMFGVGWFVAWMISLWQRGAEAPGRCARRLLLAMLGSVLIGVALLLGNGDISVNALDPFFGRKPTPVDGHWGTSLIALVLGGLVPFLNPKRLVQSGLRSEKKGWERYVFALSSTAMLVGMPLVLIGLFAQENISGYNTHPHRELVKEDIENWPGLTGIILPYQRENLGEPERQVVNELRLAITRLDRAYEPKPQAPANPQATSVAIGKEQEIQGQRLAWHSILQQLYSIQTDTAEENWLARSNRKVRLEKLRNERLAIVIQGAADIVGEKREFETMEAFQQHAVEDLQRDPTGAHTEWIAKLRHRDRDLERRFDIDRLRYLCCLSIALEKSLQDQDFDLAEIHHLGSWKHSRWDSFKHKCANFLHAFGWFTGLHDHEQTNEVAAYWSEKVASENLEDEICHVLLQGILDQPLLLERLVEMTPDKQTLEKRGSRFQMLIHRAKETDVATWLPYERRELIRYLLEESLPNIVRDRTQIRRRVTIVVDQWTRLRYAGMAFLAFLVLGLAVNVNTTSMHRYYRNRLEQVFLAPRSARAPSWSVAELLTTSFGAPYHLICASVGLLNKMHSGAESVEGQVQNPNDVSLHQRIVPFLFSQRYCGSELTNFAPTLEYESSVADAVALSGAAVTPTQMHNPLLAFLMFALNLRLGQWLPNPRRRKPARRPTIFSLTRNIFRSPEKREHCFVTDGGHSDNVGLLPLLDRRCQLIFLIDASHDPRHEFEDLARSCRIARIHSGIQMLELDTSRSAPNTLLPKDWATKPLQLPPSSDSDPPPVCQRHILLARIRYPDAPDGLLVYVKPSFTGDESLDLMQYRASNRDFPHETSNDQLFDEIRVESYRQLGFHIASELCQLIPSVAAGGDLWTAEHVGTSQLQDWLMERGARPEAAPERTMIVAPPVPVEPESTSLSAEVSQVSTVSVSPIATEPETQGVATTTAVVDSQVVAEATPASDSNSTGDPQTPAKEPRPKKPR